MIPEADRSTEGPVIVSINKMAPALLTGNCVIIKPSLAPDLQPVDIE